MGEREPPTSLYNPPDTAEGYALYRLNCGPCALAALVGKPVLELRPLFHQFPHKPWANPSLMRAALVGCGWRHEEASLVPGEYPVRGLAFIQWEGPWLDPNVPVAAAYHNTHWIATFAQFIYDVNAGRWIHRDEWENTIAPLLVANTKRATGWHVKLGIEATERLGDVWGPTLCGCGGCNICGFTGLARRPDPPPKTLDENAENGGLLDSSPPVNRRKKPARPSLFDGAE